MITVNYSALEKKILGQIDALYYAIDIAIHNEEYEIIDGYMYSICKAEKFLIQSYLNHSNSQHQLINEVYKTLGYEKPTVPQLLQRNNSKEDTKE